jgi:hypothetical protein
MRGLLTLRKDTSVSIPFNIPRETNYLFKNIYKQHKYAGPYARWNGGTHNKYLKMVRSVIATSLTPTFTNKIMKDLSYKIMFHGFETIRVSKKRKFETDNETTDPED